MRKYIRVEGICNSDSHGVEDEKFSESWRKVSAMVILMVLKMRNSVNSRRKVSATVILMVLKMKNSVNFWRNVSAIRIFRV